MEVNYSDISFATEDKFTIQMRLNNYHNTINTVIARIPVVSNVVWAQYTLVQI